MQRLSQGAHLRLLLPKTELDLAVTFDCGQCFRFLPQPNGEFLGVAHGRILRLKQTETEILLYDMTEQEFLDCWQAWFDLSTGYADILAALTRSDETLQKAVAFSPGIHILRQEPFEALVSFLISQNNNIPRIRSSIERLCERFGKALDGAYAFPDPQTLAGCQVSDLAGLGLGYRDEYLLDCARRIATGSLPLEDCFTLPLEQARALLRTIRGVGPKVADCVLLFGFHRMDAFPIDTWMKKILAAAYPQGLPPEFLQYGGLAQQYLFRYARWGSRS